jgi:hypothetical protein
VPARSAAWIRYGGERLTDDQVAFAAEHYRVAILQPWETDAAAHLKDVRPDMVVLCYKCLSSTRNAERGPIYASGVSFEEAEEAGEHWFAHRRDGSRIEWATYPGHWQMAVWEPEYRERWCDNVADDLEDAPWDGVMADNDVYDDYYGLRPPLEGDRGLPELRAALGELVRAAGTRLNEQGRLLVPNIAESRREPGRWQAHAAYGGGFDEVWLAWGPDDHFDPDTCMAQVRQAPGPGVTILRTASDGTDEHPNFRYGLAAFWIFGGGAGGGFTATAHDGYSGTPWIPEQDWDLGTPVDEPRQRGNGWTRDFSGGWAAVNFNTGRRRKITFSVPDGLYTADGSPAGGSVTLQPKHGVMFRR